MSRPSLICVFAVVLEELGLYVMMPTFRTNVLKVISRMIFSIVCQHTGVKLISYLYRLSTRHLVAPLQSTHRIRATSLITHRGPYQTTRHRVLCSSLTSSLKHSSVLHNFIAGITFANKLQDAA